tara:strand:- start:2134 stop:2751 length:618 start_codon:yes stop_codon:yes gene_type:complete
MWYNELELEYYIEQQAISHMWYNELELESIIDDFFQPTFDKIEKPKPTPINDVFSCIDLRELIFGFQKEILQDDLKSIEKKTRECEHNMIDKPAREFKIGDKYYDYSCEKRKKLYQVTKITDKSIISYPLLSIVVPTLDDGLGRSHTTEYYKYTNELGTEKKIKRKSSLLDYLKQQDMEMYEYKYIERDMKPGFYYQDGLWYKKS